jgi:hypothetical protein
MTFFIHDRVGVPKCPYLERWILNFKWFSFRLHKWHGSDDQRHFHDHGWWYVTFVLYGEYNGISPSEIIRLKAGNIAFRKAKHQHKVLLIKKPCWTFLITGAERRVWGFWVNGKFKKRNRYFFDHRHHPCE